MFPVLLCLYRIAMPTVLTTLLYASDERKRTVLWLQLTSVVLGLLCGCITVGRFFVSMVCMVPCPRTCVAVVVGVAGSVVSRRAIKDAVSFYGAAPQRTMRTR